MFRYVLRRVLVSLPILLLASVIVFAVVRSTIDPLAGCFINPRASKADCVRLTHELGLDRPMYVQYMKWLTHFARGDWGTSLLSSRPVFPDIRSALANTLILGLTATAFSLMIGIGIGLYSAVRQYSLFDHVVTGSAFLGLSMPNFWFALLLQVFFGIYLTKWLGLHERSLPRRGWFGPEARGSTSWTGFDIWPFRCWSSPSRRSRCSAGTCAPRCWRCSTPTT